MRNIRDANPLPGTEGAVAKAFVLAGARSPAAARTLEALGVAGAEGATRLTRRGLLRETVSGSGQFYLDTEPYERRNSRRILTQLALVLLAATLAIAALVFVSRPA